jgi:hypothetical protein
LIATDAAVLIGALDNCYLEHLVRANPGHIHAVYAEYMAENVFSAS